MKKQIEDEWLVALSEWASSIPVIKQAWIFGSRAKGTASNASDLDVALLVHPEDGDPLAEWVSSAKTWRRSAQKAVGDFPNVDLQLMNKEDDDIIWPAVLQHGICFFEFPMPGIS